MEVHDYTVGDSRFSLVTRNGDIAYVVIGGNTFVPDDFEKMHAIYMDFPEEERDDGSE